MNLPAVGPAIKGNFVPFFRLTVMVVFRFGATLEGEGDLVCNTKDNLCHTILNILTLEEPRERARAFRIVQTLD